MREGLSQWRGSSVSRQGVVGQYDEQPEDEELGEVQPGQVVGALVVFHGVGDVGSTEGEVGEQEEHAEDASVHQIEPRECVGAAAACGGGVHGRWLFGVCRFERSRAVVVCLRWDESSLVQSVLEAASRKWRWRMIKWRAV